MKKTLAIIFLLLANITLLVHAAIPHHKHDGDFCFITSSCENECDGHDKHHHQKHEHDSENGNMKCELNKILIIHNNANPKHEVIILDLDHLPLTNLSLVSRLNHLPDTDIYQRDLKSQIPLKLSLYHIFINNSAGLRAPPSFV